MTQSYHRFSFVIPTLNESAMLGRLLTSIKSQEHTNNISIQEIIVADACSSDDTIAIAEAYNCTVISTQPGKVSKSRNLGAQGATGNILAFIDADCELPKNWLQKVSTELSDPDVVAVGAKMAKNQASTSWVEKAWFELAHKSTSHESSTKVDWLATFNLAVRKATFDLIEGFDVSLSTCEDVEFGYRLRSQGILKRIEDSGVIHHGESKTLNEFYRREAWRSRGALEILKKHWTNPRELASFMLPIIVVLGLTFSFFMIGASMIAILMNTDTMWHYVFLALISGPLPLLLLVIRRKVEPAMTAKCIALLGVYFTARFRGTFSPFPRVSR